MKLPSLCCCTQIPASSPALSKSEQEVHEKNNQRALKTFRRILKPETHTVATLSNQNPDYPSSLKCNAFVSTNIRPITLTSTSNKIGPGTFSGTLSFRGHPSRLYYKVDLQSSVGSRLPIEGSALICRFESGRLGEVHCIFQQPQQMGSEIYDKLTLICPEAATVKISEV